MWIIHIFLRIIYRAIDLTGFFSTGIGQRTYEFAFGKFKLITEGKVLEKVCSFIKPGSLVIDVGANIGIYTKLFLNCAGPGGKVAAVEPEAVNLKSLRRQFSSELESERLVLFDRVAADQPGDYHLWIDTCNPGGHAMAPAGVPVKGITIDQITSQINLIPSLIKIDVEGYEELVIRGAKETIAEHHPVLFLEFNPRLLSNCGTDYVQLLRNLAGQNYKFILSGAEEEFYEATVEQVIEKSKARHWLDIIVVPGKR